MAVYRIEEQSLIAIGDEIRTLSNVEDAMSLNDMISSVKTACTNIDNAFTTIQQKGGEVPSVNSSQFLSSSIDSIPTGVTVQRTTGNVVVSGTTKTVDCGFEPDAVFFLSEDPWSNNSRCHGCAAFYEDNITSCMMYFSPPSTSYYFSWWTVTQTSTGFKVKGQRLSQSSELSNESNRSVKYIAIKYTE